MPRYVRSKGRGKPGVSDAGIRMLQRVADAQEASGSAAVPIKGLITAQGQWYTLQSLLGRVLVSTAGDGRIRVTGPGWRLLRAVRGGS